MTAKKIFLKKSKTINTTNIQDIMLILAIFLVMIFLLLDPTTYATSVINGLKLFFTAVLPGLLPFMFLCKMLTNLNISRFFNFLSKPMNYLFGLSSNCFYAFFMSSISGYPIGSKITSDLYSQNKIKDNEILKCALLSSTSGPVFVIGSVGAIMLQNAKIGLIIYISNITASILSIVFIHIIEILKNKKRGYKSKNNINDTPQNNALPSSLPTLKQSEKANSSNSQSQANLNTTISPAQKSKKQNFLNIMASSASDTAMGLLIVGFYIAFFFTFIDLLKNTQVLGFFANIIKVLFGSNPDKMALSEGVMSGIVEMTKGAKILSSIQSPLSISLISMLIAFGGLSIIFQSLSFLSNTKVKFGKFILGKALQSVIAFALCFCLLTIFPF